MLKLLTICLLLLSTLGCTRDLHTTSHLVSSHHRDQYSVVSYPGTWEYRYGDSPRRADGSFQFADPSFSDGTWKATGSPYIPPGRGDTPFLWLRTRLMGPPLSDPALFFQSINQSYQAFLDGVLIAEFGEMEGERARRFSGEPRAYLPLVPPLAQLSKGSAEHASYVGRVLTLRIYSPHRYIGIFGPVLLGARTSILATQVHKGISVFVVALILIAIGIIALVLFALRYQETTYLYYGLFTIATGVHFLSRTSLHELLFHAPAIWGVSTLFALPVVASSMCAFLWKTLGRGPFSAMPILAVFFMIFFVVAALIVGTGHENPWQILLPLQVAMLFGIVIQVITLTLAAWRGDTNARILSVGSVFCAAVAVIDILGAMNLIEGEHNINSHYGVAGLVLALAVVLARRFVRLTLMTDRAARLEQESAEQAQRLAEQSNLLSAAARMAKGDLVAEISVPAGNELAPLAAALDSMRQDLKRKLTQLEQNNLAIRGLNDELRRQIEQRSRRLMETVAQGLGNAPQRPAQVAPGKRLGDHYQVLATIGSGAMGTVFEVERTTDHKRFAAKILTEARKKTSLLRFAREAQILCRLDHPNLISIVDIDVTKDGVVFLVMELVRGTVLKAWKEKFGNLRFAVDVLKQMTAGLAIIHRSGIVHRDLKPANVLLAEVDGVIQVKLADFGISILSAQGSSGLRPYSGSVSDSANLPPLDSDSGTLTGDDYAEFHISEEIVPAKPLGFDTTGGFLATQSLDENARHSSRVFEPTGEDSVDSAAETNHGIGPAGPAEPPDAHLTATGVLVGTVQGNFDVRRCEVLERRSRWIRKSPGGCVDGRRGRTLPAHPTSASIRGEDVADSLIWKRLCPSERQRTF